MTNIALLCTGHLQEIGMFMITNFLELGVVAGISRMLADCQHAITLPWP
jgi:hypothetical protein